MGCKTSKIKDSSTVGSAVQRRNLERVETAKTETTPQRIQDGPLGTSAANGSPTSAEDAQTVDAYTTTRLILLGAAESGKTTVLEQIRLLYNHNYTDSELLHRRTFIFENIVSSMFQMLAFMNQVNEPFGNSANIENVELIKEQLGGSFSRFSNSQLEALKSLWNDPGIQAVYSRRGEYNLNDSTKYFYENLDRINALDFKPTPHDIIMAYCPTAGVQNVNFTVNNHTYQKWSLLYDGITAVIFCIAISEYDQKLMEDGTTNRLHDALDLLEQICSEPKFSSTWIIVFLNEVDMFEEKLSKVPLSNFMPDYEGSNNFKDAKSYLEKIVYERCRNHPDLLHIEFTCAIDTDEMKKILERTFKILRHKKRTGS